MLIRPAVPGDVDALVRVINAAYVVEAFFKAGDRIDADAARARLKTGTFLVVVDDDGAILGSIFVRVTDDRGYFGLLSVAPQAQGQGLARQLINAAEGHARAAGCRAMDLTIVNLRTELPAFYQRFGYVEVGTEPFDDPDQATQPCHFIRMSKSL